MSMSDQDPRPDAGGVAAAVISKPLAGLRVLELGHYVAAPFCTRLLGDLGADVIKIEPLEGDPVRLWGADVDGRSLWWSMHGRNKRSVTMNLKSPKAVELVRRLASACDVVVENFRPGQLAKMGLGPDQLRQANPNLVVAQISGYGQDGPYRDRAAFGVIGEALGGLRYLTNHPPSTHDLPPVRVGVSIGDSIAGLYAAFGVVAALWQRDRRGGDDVGRTVDVALTESVLSMMEGMLPEFGRFGKIKQPTGGGIATAAPSNAYPTSDGGWMLIAANSDPLFSKLAALIGQPELASAPEYSGNRERVQNVVRLDAIIGSWSVQLTTEEAEKRLSEAGIPSGKAYTAADCADDLQYRYRGMIRSVEDPHLGAVLQCGIVPHFVEAPGDISRTGPDIGEHTDEVLNEILGIDAPALADLRLEGVIS